MTWCRGLVRSAQNFPPEKYRVPQVRARPADRHAKTQSGATSMSRGPKDAGPHRRFEKVEPVSPPAKTRDQPPLVATGRGAPQRSGSTRRRTPPSMRPGMVPHRPAVGPERFPSCSEVHGRSVPQDQPWPDPPTGIRGPPGGARSLTRRRGALVTPAPHHAGLFFTLAPSSRALSLAEGTPCGAFRRQDARRAEARIPLCGGLFHASKQMSKKV